MVEITRFAHGYHYGDYSGVVFYGLPENGFWSDRLAASNTYISPLFFAILDREWRESGGERTPRLVSEWNTLTGWAGCGAGIVPVSPEDANALLGALISLTATDLSPHVAGCTAEECLECASAIRDFLYAHLALEHPLFVADD
ncbi:MAG: hypothetical protein K2V38_24880 [Gemmataceae bacterium]|nr:hypothetical protein [Gemmataceae bacterium]